jgi:hypothetical protein
MSASNLAPVNDVLFDEEADYRMCVQLALVSDTRGQ